MSVSERASARSSRTKEDRNPVYLAFAKVNGGWVKLGAAWRWKSGDDGLSVQLSALPLQWDGRLILTMPDESGEPPSGE